MSKYDLLWNKVAASGEAKITLTFAQIEEISGVPIDHSFLKYKKELESCGYRVGKISMKNCNVTFERMSDGKLR